RHLHGVAEHALHAQIDPPSAFRLQVGVAADRVPDARVLEAQVQLLEGGRAEPVAVAPAKHPVLSQIEPRRELRAHLMSKLGVEIEAHARHEAETMAPIEGAILVLSEERRARAAPRPREALRLHVLEEALSAHGRVAARAALAPAHRAPRR